MKAPDAKQSEVLDAAAHCFMARGYDATTIDHIAAALGATKGRVYHHFETKADILFSVYGRALDKCFAGVQPALDADLAAPDKLSAIMRAHILTMMEALPYHTVANMGVEVSMREGVLTARQRETMAALTARRDAYEAEVRRVVRQGVRGGTLVVSNLAITTRTLLASINAVSAWYRPRTNQGPAARAAIAEAVVDTLLHGIVRPRLPQRQSRPSVAAATPDAPQKRRAPIAAPRR